MRIEIIAKNSRVSEKLADIINKKVGKLDKYFEDDTICRIYLKNEAKKSKMEIQVDYKGNFLRAQAYEDTFFDALDVVLPKLESQIYKHRTRLEKQLRQSAFKDKMIFAEDLPVDPKLVKTKRFEMRPMSVEEAIEEFGMIGHSFYVFVEEGTNAVKVLYLRDDGNYGIIEPVLA